MKKLHVLGALAFIITAFLSCKKVDQDPDYKFTIIVKTVDDSTRVQNAQVRVGVPTSVSEVQMFGNTDVNGEITFDYHEDAVFQVIATRGDNPYTYKGCTHVRLEPNQNVIKEIFIIPYNENFPGCILEF